MISERAGQVRRVQLGDSGCHNPRNVPVQSALLTHGKGVARSIRSFSVAGLMNGCVWPIEGILRFFFWGGAGPQTIRQVLPQWVDSFVPGHGDYKIVVFLLLSLKANFATGIHNPPSPMPAIQTG